MYWVLNQRICLSHYTSLMGQKKIVSILTGKSVIFYVDELDIKCFLVVNLKDKYCYPLFQIFDLYNNLASGVRTRSTRREPPTMGK
jgi:hypothetical protein